MSGFRLTSRRLRCRRSNPEDRERVSSQYRENRVSASTIGRSRRSARNLMALMDIKSEGSSNTYAGVSGTPNFRNSPVILLEKGDGWSRAQLESQTGITRLYTSTNRLAYGGNLRSA